MRISTVCRPILTTAILLVAVPVALSQYETVIDPTVTAHSSYSKHNLVKDAAGKLYCFYLHDTPTGDREVRLVSSTNGGNTWSVEPFVFNDLTSGLTGSNLANGCAAAIDSSGRLHVCWHRYYYPSYFNQYYRWYDPGTGASSAVIDLTSSSGTSTSVRTSALCVAVDANDYVWISVHGTSSWITRLAVSTAPFNTTPAFNMIGPMSSNGYSAQSAQIAIDSNGLIHTIFYNNSSVGLIMHRAYDPVAGTWTGVEFNLGDTITGHDDYGQLAADALGNVHAYYVKNVTVYTPTYEYRMWNNGTWGPAIPLATFTSAQLGSNNTLTHSLMVNESNGTAWVTYRDFAAAGELKLFEKTLTAASFTYVHDLEPATTATNEYIYPSVRGGLYPAFNRTGTDPMGLMRKGGTAPFQEVFLNYFGNPAGKPYGQGCPGSGSFIPKVMLGAASNPVPGGSLSIDISNGLGGSLCYLFLGLNQAALPMGAGCTLNVQPIVSLLVFPLGGSGPGAGSATLTGPLPGTVSNYSFTMQAFCVDPVGALGFANSNGLKITIP